MAVYRGTAPLRAYKGDMQPANVYRGSTKVAGWHSASYSGASPLAVDCDYNVAPDALTIDGKCVQTGTPDPSTPAPISTITGNMTITGADGASSDTATVALGSNVCASLPDGTHDSYDAVTGVLTKNVGKVVEASGTSWTIDDAASGSSILSDCFGADVLSGTGFSARDAACQPNLTPFFSHSFTDASYWKRLYTAYITQLTDGWAHVAYDNSAGKSAVWPAVAVIPQSFVDSGTTYTVVAEFKNISGTTYANKFFVSETGYAAQSQLGGISADISCAFSEGTHCVTVKSLSDLTPSTIIYLAYSGFGVSAGSTVSFDLRLSLYKGTYTGDYKPYALPCAPTIYYAIATPTTVQLTPHLTVVRTGTKTLSVGADVVPTLSATVKSMD